VQIYRIWPISQEKGAAFTLARTLRHSKGQCPANPNTMRQAMGANHISKSL
jgi:hypothetical protein